MLARARGVGPATFRDLVALYGSPAAALAELPRLAAAGGRSGPVLRPASEIDAEIAALTKAGAQLLAIGAPEYPHALAQLDAPPPVLSIIGRSALLNVPLVAMVGARSASAQGCEFAFRLAARLVSAGFGVVSGLARGIDAAAHRGAGAETVAVIGGGLGTIYPPEHAALQAEIGRTGALVSAMPFHHQAVARDFPRRNAIIAGLARGVVVVEAAERSGSLVTARLAGEAGREVLAVPGHPLDPRSVGCNMLLRDGATIVTRAEDILEALAQPASDAWRGMAEPQPEMPAFAPADAAAPGDAERRGVRDALSTQATEIDIIVRATGLPPGTVLVVLIELELAGRLVREGSRHVALRPTPASEDAG